MDLKRWLKESQKSLSIRKLYQEKGLENLDMEALLITLDHIGKFSDDTDIQTALENGQKFYCLTPNSEGWNHLLEPKAKKIDGIWRLHGKN